MKKKEYCKILTINKEHDKTVKRAKAPWEMIPRRFFYIKNNGGKQHEYKTISS